jgi:hypothetical protein
MNLLQLPPAEGPFAPPRLAAWPLGSGVLLLSALVLTPVRALPGQQGSQVRAAHAPTVATARRLTGTIRLDGRLDEAAWATAPVTSSFTQLDPDEGRPASQRTEVRVLYDDDALYVGARLFDSGPMRARLGRRDMSLGDSDWFGVMIDSYHDHRTAFGFDVNPAGVRRDEVKTIDVDDNSWDPVWDVATSIDAEGWTAEYRIPFSQLRFSGDSVQTWGILFERVIGRRFEYASSTFTPKSERGGVPRYGHLEGIAGIGGGRRLEMLPYVVQRAEFVDPGPNPFRSEREYFTSAGLDLLFRPTPNLTLNATFNPDFGQVEVDPAIVNLGVYETFFEEKRPFFIEGSEIFQFGASGTSGGQIFYSRRIGRVPTLAGGPANDAPTNTTILGAAKLSGKLQGWSLGLLGALTAREESRTMIVEPSLPGGPAHPPREDRTTAEPAALYAVARARREMRNGQSFVGAILTSVHRDLDDAFPAQVLHRSALTGGIDFRHEWSNRSWSLSGDVEGSRVSGSSAAIARTQRQSNHYFQRPDADHLDYDSLATSLAGYSMNATLAKQAGTHWRGDVAVALTSPGYETNDAGFSYRTDRRDVQVQLRYVENRPGRLRNWGTNSYFRAEHNYDWERILMFAGLGFHGRTLGFWSLEAFVQHYFPAMDDRLTRGGPLARRPSWTSLGTFVGSDRRKPFALSSFITSEVHQFGGWSYSAAVSGTVRTSSRWNLTVGPRFQRRHATAQFMFSAPDTSSPQMYDRRYVFAPLDQTELSVETRFNLTFTPKLSLETFVQPLISTGDYGDPRQLRAARTYAFIPYGGSAPDLDFNFRSLRGNAVLRWEWRPGSTMFLAWQQNRSDLASFGDFSLGRDRRALFGAPPDNIFLVKVNYWVNP